MKRERGSALVITLMLLLILTAIGIYAISVSTTEMDVTLQSRIGTATLDAAEAGAHQAIDTIPPVPFSGSGTLANATSYSVQAWATGLLSLAPGYGSNFRFADYGVQSTGSGPPQFVAQRTVQAVMKYGPVPVGTMY